MLIGLCNFDHLKPHFYAVKLGFTGVDIIFQLLKIGCGYSLECLNEAVIEAVLKTVLTIYNFSRKFHLKIVIFTIVDKEDNHSQCFPLVKDVKSYLKAPMMHM